jgi:hypothetical protein
MGDGKDIETEKILAAYHVAHENAHHHDLIIWEAAAIIWSANALLMGFVLEAVSSSKLRVHALIAASSLLGIGMTSFLLLSFRRMKRNQEISWKICQDIEKKLGMEFKVHSKIDEDYENKGARTRMQVLYRILSTLFIIIWLAFFFVAIGRILTRIYDCF